ncbi:MAG: type VI secretion system baseplate subunit TssF [Candidatus Contendobacter odensis]|uniref:Type VI secretion system baseplate subunit TssF n=1 Tax=Candidatus Contendibacter odensensis TaxID=1400860 RepID=A0A2G6PFW9_9GAMM|nr:MAG: type VI secretion system baseplate subunit TssF [Candidatus Contendobacter odensis]
MDPRLLEYYNRELQHLRELGGEFAHEYPKIAGRLGLEGLECADPYVERLLEGFGFLAARVQLKMDDEFPRFTQHLLEIIYPHYLAPTPSMLIAQFQPDPAQGALNKGFVIPRGEKMRSLLAKGEQTPCEYLTAHDVTLWPIKLAEAHYFAGKEPVTSLDLPNLPKVRAGIRLRLRTTLPSLPFNKLALAQLPLFLNGSDGLPGHLYEQLLANTVMVVARGNQPVPWHEVIAAPAIQRLGFENEQGLLPYTPPSFQGYRLLHEYFTFPQRYLFVELTGLEAAVQRCQTHELELLILLDRADATLENTINTDHFSLFCAPAINLFPKRLDRIHISNQVAEHHAVPDRTRPMDYEIYQVTSVTGIGAEGEEQEFLPFYADYDRIGQTNHQAFYAVHRLPRVLSSRQQRNGPRSSYSGHEIYLSLVDAHEAPYRSNLRQLAITALCTNRDLPLHMPLGRGDTDFSLASGAPVSVVRCLAGPTRPHPSAARGDIAWRLISHLSLNYLSLADSDERQGAVALRELLALYGNMTESAIRKQIEGVRSVSAKPITRRAPIAGPIALARGLEVTVSLDELAFEGVGIFLLGAVLEQFFAKYVSLNSFTETVIRSTERGEVMRWPARIGQRHTL